MPKKPKEMERLILHDGWYPLRQTGSHRHYAHPSKAGIVTIPFHSRELTRKTEASIYRQAGLKGDLK